MARQERLTQTQHGENPLHSLMKWGKLWCYGSSSPKQSKEVKQ
jgi:hypothetical protein